MRAAIGLGSNLGIRLSMLRQAVEQLGRYGEIVAVSSLYRSEPVGGPEQPDFLNAVIVIETDLDLQTLLATCQQIEASAGRVRDERWGPRTLDLDILTAAAPPYSSETLMVPHERLAERRFAVEPLAEVWPDAATGFGTARSKLDDVRDQSVDRLAASGWQVALSKGVWWVTAQVVLLILVVGTAFRYSESFDARWIGVPLFLGGVTLAARAMQVLGSSLTPFPQPLQGAAMISSGPYGLVRHPIYGGLILSAAGLALFMGSWIAVGGSLALGGFFWLKSSFEERRLLVAHSRYRRYMDEVPKRLIPFIV